MEEFVSTAGINSTSSVPTRSNSAHSTSISADDARLNEAREQILRGTEILKTLGPDYARVAWLVEDSLGMLHSEEFDSMVDFDSEFEILTREFIPAVRQPDVIDRPRGKTGKKSRTVRR